eukprot:gene3269-4094_t
MDDILVEQQPQPQPQEQQNNYIVSLEKCNGTSSSIDNHIEENQPQSQQQDINYKLWHTEFPIEVLRHPSNGRYMISTEELEESTVILKDLPYTWAVDHCAHNYVCQQCFLEVPIEQQINDNDFLICSGCERVGYCSSTCMDIDRPQHSLECKILDVIDSQEYSSTLISEMKLLLRTLSRKWLEQSLKEDQVEYYKNYKNPASLIPQDNGLRYKDYNQLVSNIESFPESLKESLSYWICKYIVKLAHEKTGRIEDEIDLLNIVLRNRCNAFYIQGRLKEGGNGESRGCGVYVRNSFFNHSCKPNVNYWVLGNSLEVECSLMRPVKKGEELSISYIDTSASLKNRREKLLEGYLFHCLCDKCIEDEMNGNFDNPQEEEEEVEEEVEEEQGEQDDEVEEQQNEENGNPEN